MSKKLIIILAAIVLVLAASGAGAYFLLPGKPQVSDKQEAQQFQRQGPENTLGERQDLIIATPDDLVIGEEVIIRGVLNEDGSITAETIYLGLAEGDFQPNFSPNNVGVGDSVESDRPMPELPEGFDPEELRGLSEKERRQRMEELFGDLDFPRQEMARGRGEIIDKDDISITLKLTEGGSMLVFYSDTTKVLKTE